MRVRPDALTHYIFMPSVRGRITCHNYKLISWQSLPFSIITLRVVTNTDSNLGLYVGARHCIPAAPRRSSKIPHHSGPHVDVHCDYTHVYHCHGAGQVFHCLPYHLAFIPAPAYIKATPEQSEQTLFLGCTCLRLLSQVRGVFRISGTCPANLSARSLSSEGIYRVGRPAAQLQPPSVAL